ncbi:MAG: alpha-L-fucosidase [Chitinophagaceae bacterium]|jgi:alpha-L-fucosidase|nr:alpha-L-fucosidase [Chitinophagaceae bacterium]
MTKPNSLMAFARFFSFLLISQLATAQDRNYVFIDSTDTEADIVRKAAQVVPSPRQLRWQQLELTAFFHFGINTFTNREWGTGKEDPQLFNPSDLDARQWISVVKKAGIRQVILTAKHHDGFCLWPTKTTRHSVASSPWKNGQGDVVREVAEASREAGIGFGVYLSPWDMNSPVYGSEAYNDLFVAQLTELLTQYGRIDEVWFDGANGEGPNGKKQEYDFNRWYALIRKLQPTATIAIMGPDVRWVGTESGHGRETEWSVVPADNLDPAAIAGNSQQEIDRKPTGDMQQQDLGSRGKIKKAKALVWYPAETDVSIRPGWFYHAAEDSRVKSNQELTDIYFNSVGRNGVLLLNIPPDKRGRIHEADEKAMLAWKATLDGIFARNLAAAATGKPKNSKALFDDNDASHLALDKGLPATLELSWKTPQTLNVLALQENIRKGQRVEAFRLEYWNGSGWETATTGTTIGYKRLLRFKTITASRIRLVITEARDTPYLASFGLYHDSRQP